MSQKTGSNGSTLTPQFWQLALNPAQRIQLLQDLNAIHADGCVARVEPANNNVGYVITDIKKAGETE